MGLEKKLQNSLKREVQEVKAICGELLRVVYFAGQVIEDMEYGKAEPQDVAEVKGVINQLMQDFGVQVTEVGENEEARS